MLHRLSRSMPLLLTMMLQNLYKGVAESLQPRIVEVLQQLVQEMQQL